MTRVAPSLVAVLLPCAGVAEVLPAVPPPAPVEREVSPEEAAGVVARVLGCVATGVRATATSFEFDVSGFTDGRACPLEGTRGVKCGGFAWQPTAATVYRHSWVAATSGHLAQNRVVVVDMTSSTAALARSSLHGVLVFPTPEVNRAPPPAFAWYVSRLGRTVGADLADVDADGALDIVYTYRQDLPGGVRVVPRDVWTVADLKPSRLISAGERLSGVALSLFEGVALAEDTDTRTVRGAWTTIPLGAGRPPAVVLDRGAWPGGGFDLRVLVDFGAGWREYLAGAGGVLAADAEAVARGDSADCSSAELPSEVFGVEARKTLLDLESACHLALDALAPGPAPVVAVRRLLAAFRLHSAGLVATAAGLVETASAELLSAGSGTWPVAAILSVVAALRGHELLLRAHDSRFAPPPAPDLDALARIPALRPLLLPLWAHPRMGFRLQGSRGAPESQASSGRGSHAAT